VKHPGGLDGFDTGFLGLAGILVVTLVIIAAAVDAARNGPEQELLDWAVARQWGVTSPARLDLWSDLLPGRFSLVPSGSSFTVAARGEYFDRRTVLAWYVCGIGSALADGTGAAMLHGHFVCALETPERHPMTVGVRAGAGCQALSPIGEPMRAGDARLDAMYKIRSTCSDADELQELLSPDFCKLLTSIAIDSWGLGNGYLLCVYEVSAHEGLDIAERVGALMRAAVKFGF
jgi:hypothetical protein